MTMTSNLSPQQIPTSLPKATLEALEFEKQQWATGSVLEDPFYSVDASQSNVGPGALLKVEELSDTSLFTLPPATALSRFIYQSETSNHSLVPVSAYLLWPYSPRSSDDGYQVVAWAHGTSGPHANCAPSHIRNLWQHYLAPFQLALQGYVVVATDYAGLGVSKTATGEPITHEYLNSSIHANDVFYSVQAAQQAFPQLGKGFVVCGHSQGGGTAWASAQRQAVNPVEGYLGAVAISPVTTLLDQLEPIRSLLIVGITPAVASVFPEFDPKQVLSDAAQERLAIVHQLGGCTATSLTLLMDIQLLRDDWMNNNHIQEFQKLTANGGKRIEGPLLVIHGDSDPNLNFTVSKTAVENTMSKFPHSQLKFVQMPGISHNPAMTASQHVWMDWIADRFAGVKQPYGLQNMELKPAAPASSYQPELNWWVALAKNFYETP